MAYIVNEYDSSKLLLSAINVLLQTINELPIEDDTDLANSATGQLAEMTLVEVKKKVLSAGWNFNTDEGYPFPPDINGYINIPYNVLDITASDTNVVMREWKLYDRDNFSFKFDDTVKCDVIWDMDFNNLTHPIRYFITVLAARTFQARTIGDQIQYAYTEKDVEEAFLNARLSETRTGKYNMLTSEYGIQNGGAR